MSLRDRLRAYLPAGVALAGADPTAPATGLLPQEEAAAARMVPARLREFAAGRRAARAAMTALGVPPSPLPMGQSRAPLWPATLTGSISHDATTCLALVGWRSDWAGIGLDIEPAMPLPADLIATICTPDESADPATARALFCAKEAAYKAISAQIRTIPAFHDMTVTLHADGSFAARLIPPFPPFQAGARIDGHLLRTPAHLAALVLIRAA
ncbi:4'-phosphopantetheinyl transferase superfamily protein [Roseovarius sp. MBR-6]|jgi:4'-phosphopantetheinyl transferase EntD|uniref:4'-phosphopantetheinyl transferase family protein n=1 Tax=Roseovarius sp. MBR-6 TaxID=3156459 RepID=UPI0033926CD1